MSKKLPQKLYVVRKYIKASSASEAIRKDRKHPVDDVWIDDAWKENKNQGLSYAVGFEAQPPTEED
jgi:hypothetical protein